LSRHLTNVVKTLVNWLRLWMQLDAQVDLDIPSHFFSCSLMEMVNWLRLWMQDLLLKLSRTSKPRWKVGSQVKGARSFMQIDFTGWIMALFSWRYGPTRNIHTEKNMSFVLFLSPLRFFYFWLHFAPCHNQTNCQSVCIVVRYCSVSSAFVWGYYIICFGI
jgi:hypothetical protein